MPEEHREDQPTWILCRRIFLAGLGGVYAIAFLSFWVQLDGLIGSDGIFPAAEFLSGAADALGSDAYRRVPTWFWLDASDTALHLVCGVGVAASLLVIVGVAPALCLALLWTLYLSLVSVGDTFLAYQWDTLLLETGLIACLFAPATRNGAKRSPHWTGLWALRWLLFRLVFTSGAAKLASGDPTWQNGTALEFHYWTQPLPTWTSYYAHHLPPLIHTASTFAALAIECLAPLLIFVPGRPRSVAAIAIVGLMGAIAMTGNYGFFNLLTVVLCISLIDDDTIRKLLRLGPGVEAPTRRAPTLWRRIVFGLVGLALAAHAFIGGVRMFDRIGLDPAHRPSSWPAPIRYAIRQTASLRSVNSYGLFVGMTTDRTEIEVEGSRDGRNWTPYRFRWKPGPLDQRPGFAQPHMPRLDWQMWFAALGPCQSSPWFLRFQSRLLAGAEDVSALLEENPFGDEPPQYIRSTVYRYRFAQPSDPTNWWQRESIGEFCPPLTLVDGRLERFPNLLEPRP